MRSTAEILALVVVSALVMVMIIAAVRHAANNRVYDKQLKSYDGRIINNVYIVDMGSGYLKYELQDGSRGIVGGNFIVTPMPESVE